MIPPGLAFITMSERAWAANEVSNMPKFYFDLRQYREYAKKGQPPWTPAVALYYGLDKALDMIVDEGFEQVGARHHAIAEYTRNKVKALGLELLAVGDEASDTVTSVRVPEGVSAAELLAMLNSDYDTVLAAGQGKLAGKIVRIGHMGVVHESDIDAAVDALDAALGRLGLQKARGRSIARPVWPASSSPNR